MKVLAINGSPEPMGNTSNILNEVQDMFERNGIEMEIVHIYDYRLTNCNVCFIAGSDMRAALSSFYEIMFAVAPASIGGAIPGDDFYCVLE